MGYVGGLVNITFAFFFNYPSLIPVDELFYVRVA